jgi:hypothetical protein
VKQDGRNEDSGHFTEYTMEETGRLAIGYAGALELSFRQVVSWTFSRKRFCILSVIRLVKPSLQGSLLTVSTSH